MTDYVYTANDKEPHTLFAQDLFRVRPQTVLLLPTKKDQTANLKSFIRDLSFSPEVDPVIGNLFLVSHGSSSGWLAISVDGKSREPIDFELLAKARNEGMIRIPLALLPKDPITDKVQPVYFHVRGCEIGKSPDFIALMQEALGGKVHVTAPKYYHGFGKWPKNDPLFWFEYLSYEFIQYYNYIPTDAKPLPNREQLIKALTQTGYKLINGDPVPTENWNNWLPKSLPTGNDMGEKYHPFEFSLDPKWNIKPSTIPSRLRTFVYNVDQPFYRTVAGGPAADSSPDERRKFMKKILEREDKFKDTYRTEHQLPPVYERYGFKTLEEFMNAFEWVYEGNNLWVSKRYYYACRVPITESKTKNQLICNYYPAGGGASHTGLLESDGRLFYTKMVKEQ